MRNRYLSAILASLGCLLVLTGCGETGGKRNPTVEPAPVGGPPMVRRLTESQYRASVADIFGEEVPVVARFGRALRSHGLIAVGTGHAGVTPFSMEQYDSAAAGVADYILDAERRDRYMPCKPDDEKGFDSACASEFVRHYGEQLFRRPLSDEQVQRFVQAAQTGSDELGSFHSGLKYALIGLMNSPEFLLRVERTQQVDGAVVELDAYSKASRLSFFLTDSSPDAELLRAAENGELNTQAGLEKQVDRLLASPQFEAAVRAFFSDMLEFDLFEDVAKDTKIYPAFNSTVAEEAQEQTLRTISHHLINQSGDYRELFTLRETFMTRALGIVYRQPVPTRNGWEKTVFSQDSGRAGIQNHISFLALHAHPGRSSPTLRGMAVREVFLCQEVPDPPPDVDFSAIDDPQANPMPTARDRLWAHNSQPACAGCHKIMDPPGLALENFDGLGTWRSRENGAVIDASGSLDGMAFSNPVEFGRALSEHPESPRCLAEKLYRFAVGRDTVWGERAYMDYLIERFAASGYQVPALMRTIALSENFFAVTSGNEPDAAIAHR